MSKKYTRGIICTLLGGICWGFSGACGQTLVNRPGIISEQITAVRMIFSGIILTAINLAVNKKKAFVIFKDRKKTARLIAFSFFGILMSQLTYIKTISYSNAGTATVLQYLGPVLIMLYMCLKERKFPNKKETVSVLLAFFGVVVIVTHFNFSGLNLSKRCIAWGLSSAFWLAMYSILPKKLIDEFGTIRTVGSSMLIGGIVMCAYPGVLSSAIKPDLSMLAGLAAMVIVGTVIAYTLYLKGVGDIGAVKASMISCIEPVSATVFSCFWLKTIFSPIDILGFAMVLSTVFIISSGEKG